MTWPTRRPPDSTELEPRKGPVQLEAKVVEPRANGARVLDRSLSEIVHLCEGLDIDRPDPGEQRRRRVTGVASLDGGEEEEGGDWAGGESPPGAPLEGSGPAWPAERR